MDGIRLIALVMARGLAQSYPIYRHCAERGVRQAMGYE
jgi:hypothetical protein